MNYFERTIISILSSGPVPGHIGFVMDGNRRFARGLNREAKEGHHEGYRTLKRVLEICFRLGVKCVSAYAFSIENFKRSQAEIDAIMGLARKGIEEICKEDELLKVYGVRLNIVGRKELLPPDLQETVRLAEERTRHHDRAVLNMCMPYTARDEIATAVQTTIDKYSDEDDLAVDDVTPDEIAANLATSLGGSPPLDMLIRTSGVKRFSDFLLWQQSDDTQIYFTEAYWPAFGLKDFIPILFDYQRKVWGGVIKRKTITTAPTITAEPASVTV